DPLVNMQGDGRHFKRRLLRLPRPDQRRVEMRIVGVAPLSGVAVSGFSDQPDRGIVLSPLRVMVVLLDRSLPGHYLSLLVPQSPHVLSPEPAYVLRTARPIQFTKNTGCQ